MHFVCWVFIMVIIYPCLLVNMDGGIEKPVSSNFTCTLGLRGNNSRHKTICASKALVCFCMQPWTFILCDVLDIKILSHIFNENRLAKVVSPTRDPTGSVPKPIMLAYVGNGVLLECCFNAAGYTKTHSDLYISQCCWRVIAHLSQNLKKKKKTSLSTSTILASSTVSYKQMEDILTLNWRNFFLMSRFAKTFKQTQKSVDITFTGPLSALYHHREHKHQPYLCVSHNLNH